MIDRTNSTINENLYVQIDNHVEGLRRQLQEFGQDAGISEDCINAIVQDYTDILTNKYTGLHLTNAMFIDGVLYKSTPQQWQPLLYSNVVLQGLFNDYRRIAEAVINIKEDMPAATIADMDTETTAKTTALYLQNLYGITEQHCVTAEIGKALNGKVHPAHLQAAIIYKHVQCLITLRQFFLTSDDDLLPILPQVCEMRTAAILKQQNRYILKHAEQYLKEERGKENIKASRLTGLFNHGEKQPKPRRKKQQTEETATTQQLLPDSKAPHPKKAALYQNMVKTLCGSIMTAQRDEEENPINPAPLLAMLSAEERSGGVEQTTARYVLQVLRGISMLPTISKSISESEERLTFKTDLTAIAKISGTGQDMPNQRMLQNYYKALCFLSTHFITIPEWRQVVTRKRGKIQYSNIWKEGSLQIIPIVASFWKDGKKVNTGNSSNISGTTEVTLEIHKAIARGRRCTFVKLDKKEELFIKQPVRYWFTLEQAQAFTSEAGVRFFSLICNASHKLELKTWTEDTAQEDILAMVFGYKEKLQYCATAEEKQQQMNNIKSNKPKDRKELNRMFQKAKDVGLISTPAQRTLAADGVNWVWEWQRTTSIEQNDSAAEVIELK